MCFICVNIYSRRRPPYLSVYSKQRNMWLVWVLISLICTVHSDISITLKHITTKNTGRKSTINITVPGNILSRIPGVPKEYSFVQIHGYNNGEELEAVENFPSLKYLWMEKLGQQKIPVIRNSTQIETLNLAYNQITRVETDLINWSTLQVVYLDTNKIHGIEDGAFGYHVTWVNLKCNKIVNLSGEWFSKPSIVQRINLHGNLIEYIPQNAFANFASLHDLNLSNNKITEIGFEAFVGSKEYEWLFLRDNQLTFLHPSIFSRKTKIKRLLLQNNNLTFLPTEFLDEVIVSGVGFIHGNPWQCPCYEKVKSWLPQNLFSNAPLYTERLQILRNSSLPQCVQKYRWKFANDFCEEWVDPKVIEVFRKNFKPFEDKKPICAIEYYEHALHL